MKRQYILLISFFICLNIFGQTTEVVFLQMNDVYEIAPLEGGKYGGLARVCTLRKDLLKENPNTYTVLSGDFISPSAIATSDYNGEKINGKQMVDVLNFIGVNFVTFGNHEFDYKPEVLQQRMNESDFDWIVSNVKTMRGEAVWKFGKTNREDFEPLPEYRILRVPNATGGYIRIGMIGICTDVNKQPYVVYEDYYASAKRVYNTIKDSIDCLVAITHLAVEEDRELAKQMPEIKLIMGGHEHQNNLEHVGQTEIAKADANARTVNVHKLEFEADNKLENIHSDLINIDESISEDAKTKELVKLWVDRAYQGFRAKGFDPDKVVTTLDEPLDGRDEFIREQQTNLGKVIAQSMLMICPGCELAFFNSGSVRIDDELKGETTQYDIIRTLPFGGQIDEVEMKGRLLVKVLETGWKNKGSGGYLQWINVSYDSVGNKWFVGANAINPENDYMASVAAFLLTGLEQNMSFFTKDNPDIIKIIEPDINNKSDLRDDVRLAMIVYLQNKEK
jgi:2',3'-cyclic-nucleotide 2'-phosphodiesterase (5'-nucleotidase family)